ncbi:hypothetical protein AAHE18_17G190900 [Arachis hypogaea]
MNQKLLLFHCPQAFLAPALVASTCVTEGSSSIKQVVPNCSAIFWTGGNAPWKIRLKTTTHPFKTFLQTDFKTWKK